MKDVRSLVERCRERVSKADLDASVAQESTRDDDGWHLGDGGHDDATAEAMDEVRRRFGSIDGNDEEDGIDPTGEDDARAFEMERVLNQVDDLVSRPTRSASGIPVDDDSDDEFESEGLGEDR